jgi:hypothetical protein
VDECPDCRAFAADLEAIRDATASLEPLAPPDGVWLQLAGRLMQEGRVSLPPARPAAPARHVALLAIAAALVLAVGASIVMLVPEFRLNNAAQPPAVSASPQPGNASRKRSTLVPLICRRLRRLRSNRAGNFGVWTSKSPRERPTRFEDGSSTSGRIEGQSNASP